MGDWTPEPWHWNDAGIVAGPRHSREYVLWFGNSINPDHLDPPVGPNETGPRWWAALLGACGKNTEKQAHFNGPRITECVNALAGIPDPAAYIKAMREVCEAARGFVRDEMSREQLTAAIKSWETISTPESEAKRG